MHQSVLRQMLVNSFMYLNSPFESYLGSTPEDDVLNVTDTFMIPRKEINMVTDMGKWKQSQVVVRVI